MDNDPDDNLVGIFHLGSASTSNMESGIYALGICGGKPRTIIYTSLTDLLATPIKKEERKIARKIPAKKKLNDLVQHGCRARAFLHKQLEHCRTVSPIYLPYTQKNIMRKPAPHVFRVFDHISRPNSNTSRDSIVIY